TKGNKDKTPGMKHRTRRGWKRVDTNKPIETTPALYRFKGVVTPKKASKLTVKEEVVQAEEIAILPADIGQLDFYSKTGEIPKDVRDALGKAMGFKQAMVDTERQITGHTEAIHG